jgi:hypothetical protein
MRHAQAVSHSAVALLLTTLVACVGEMPPPPQLAVTSPQRGMIRGEAGRVTVQGVTLPAENGDRVTKVTVNKTTATLAADGSFTATLDLPPGAMLLETTAITEAGGSITDARAVQVGELRPVGTKIEKAVTAALSKDAFAKLSAVAGPLLKDADISAMLAPLQPIANLGDSLANLKLSITTLSIGTPKITLTPVDGGLEFSAEIGPLTFGANAAYGGTLVPDGSTAVSVSADKITISGKLVVTPAGVDGFTTKIATPTVNTTGLKLSASGLAGRVLTLMNDNLGSTVQTVTTRGAELALTPILNAAFGALGGEQRLDILGQQLRIQASPAAVTFSRDGALVTVNLQATIGATTSPGYIYTPNGTPSLNVGSGIQVAIADDLLNQMLAEVHALGLLDIHYQDDFGLFDTLDIKLAMPPMIGANNTDGTVRLVLGDMVATFTDKGKTVISAAVNASIEVEIENGAKPEEIALAFGDIHTVVNIIGDSTGMIGGDLEGAANAGIALQLDSLSKFMISVPVPSVAGVQLDSLAMRADSGYVVVSGKVH